MSVGCPPLYEKRHRTIRLSVCLSVVRRVFADKLMTHSPEIAAENRRQKTANRFQHVFRIDFVTGFWRRTERRSSNEEVGGRSFPVPCVIGFRRTDAESRPLRPAPLSDLL